MPNELKGHLLDGETWIRLAFMVLFGVVGYVGLLVVLLVVLAQFILKLFTGRPNQRLRVLGDALGGYYQQIIAFLCQSSEEKPYPFSPWPSSEEQATTPRRRTPPPKRVALDIEE